MIFFALFRWLKKRQKINRPSQGLKTSPRRDPPTDKEDTEKYRWCDPPQKWNWQTCLPTFVHLSYTFTHLLDVLNRFTPAHTFATGHVYPVYITGEVPPPDNTLRFTLTVASHALKQLLFPNFFDSEMGQQYVKGSTSPRIVTSKQHS